jgi:hypothetical protein
LASHVKGFASRGEHRTPWENLGNRKTLCRKGFCAGESPFFGGGTANNTHLRLLWSIATLHALAERTKMAQQYAQPTSAPKTGNAESEA